MKVRTMVVTMEVETDASLRDLKERGFWDHMASTQLRIRAIEAHEARRHVEPVQADAVSV